MKALVIVILTALVAGNADWTRADEAQLSPFVAVYDVKYGSFSVGTSRTGLSRSALPGQWLIESRTTASGLAKLIAGGTIVQRSSFQLDASGVQPLSYRFDDGTKRTARDVTLDFDWRAGRVKGIAEGAAVDIEVETGLQDAASMQAFVLQRLSGGNEPGMIAMIEKDRVQHYRHTLLRHERLSTALGVFDTVVYRSARDGSKREVLLWYAPALGYVNVRAEQRRDGKLLFQTYIKTYQPGA